MLMGCGRLLGGWLFWVIRGVRLYNRIGVVLNLLLDVVEIEHGLLILWWAGSRRYDVLVHLVGNVLLVQVLSGVCSCRRFALLTLRGWRLTITILSGGFGTWTDKTFHWLFRIFTLGFTWGATHDLVLFRGAFTRPNSPVISGVAPVIIFIVTAGCCSGRLLTSVILLDEHILDGRLESIMIFLRFCWTILVTWLYSGLWPVSIDWLHRSTLGLSDWLCLDFNCLFLGEQGLLERCWIFRGADVALCRSVFLE